MEVQDIPGECVGTGQACTTDNMCRGAGYGCFGGVCKPLECNVNTSVAGMQRKKMNTPTENKTLRPLL